MSRWVRLLGALIPLLGLASSWHVVNVAILPAAGGVIYGLFSSRRRDVLLAPLAALLPVLAVLSYYALLDYGRLLRLFEVAPIVPALWVVLWILFFSLGAAAGYLLRRERH